MPPTPSRGSSRPERSRQGSSLHPTGGPATSSAHPYGGRRGGGGGGGGHTAVGAGGATGLNASASTSRSTPFVHPALAASAHLSGHPSGGPHPTATSAGVASLSSTHARGRKPFNHRNLFAKDLRNLMYAFGDVANPDPESVALLEEMTVDFITDLCARARPSPYALGLGTSSLSTSSSAYGATLDPTAPLDPALDPHGNLAPSASAAEIATALQPHQHGRVEASSVNGAASALTLPPRAPHRQRVKLEDFRHALRKDVESKKLGRLEQLLYADRIVTEARKVGGVEEVAEKAGALNAEGPSSSGAGGTAAGGGEGALDNEGGEGQSDSGFGSGATVGGAKGSRLGRGRGGRSMGKGRGVARGGRSKAASGAAATAS